MAEKSKAMVNLYTEENNERLIVRIISTDKIPMDKIYLEFDSRNWDLNVQDADAVGSRTIPQSVGSDNPQNSMRTI